jgi:virginiamycin B lyase
MPTGEHGGFHSTNSLHVFADSGSPLASPITEFPLNVSGSYPLGVTTDSAGNVWFANANTDMISVFFPSNDTFRNFPIPTPPHLAMIWFPLFDRNGYLWFGDPVQPLIWRFSPFTDQFTNYTTGSSNLEPYSMVYNPNTNQIWFSTVNTTGTGEIGAFQISPNETARLVSSVLLPSPSGANAESAGVASDSQGDVFVSEPLAGKIVEYDPNTGDFLHIWSLPPYAQPVGIAVDQSRKLIWFADHASSLFGFVNETSGSVVQIATSLFRLSSAEGSTTISLPYWISVASNGDVWFDEHVGNKIARFDPSTLQLDEFEVPTSASEPLRFSMDHSRGLVWFTEFVGDKLGRIDLNASAGMTVAYPEHAELSGKVLLTTNLNYSQIGNTSLSGSLSIDGFLTSNLSMSTKSVNATATQISIEPYSTLAPGNYSLTVCPAGSGTEYAKACSVVFVTVVTGGFSSSTILVYMIAIVAVAAIAVVSVIYVRRWNS